MEEEIIVHIEEILNESGSETTVETEIPFENEVSNKDSLIENHQEKDPSIEKPKLIKLPLSRVKNIIKMDSEIGIISNDSVFAVTKATELFLQLLIREAVRFTNSTKRKTILKKDLVAAIDSIPQLFFLDGVLE